MLYLNFIYFTTITNHIFIMLVGTNVYVCVVLVWMETSLIVAL